MGRKNPTKNINIGLLAHVDAGKTTLSEALLYATGQIRALGRVDHQDAFLDTDAQERARGITIFSKQARFRLNSEPSVGVEVPLRGAQRQSQPTNESSHGESSVAITILDTPGHVDFSAEMERTLQVLDYAILVISGTDGVQGHTRTLWRLLRLSHSDFFVCQQDGSAGGGQGSRAAAVKNRTVRWMCGFYERQRRSIFRGSCDGKRSTSG